ncbi:hypothetical protein [Bradyrhizobium prioriisuperbiae]|uniref:hypothetical protein n=1 Tax=Bradyrhizobium prioriisuperbiae TaxID=2854389 RepID=UPI0028E59261|nr:hypothetical protein [Bradyrhizobium prioritasuperba]
MEALKAGGVAAVHSDDDVELGGYRWIILALAWLTFLISFVDRLAWGNVSIPVGQTLGMPVAALGIFVTAFYVGYVIANFVGGFGSDREQCWPAPLSRSASSHFSSASPRRWPSDSCSRP